MKLYLYFFLIQLCAVESHHSYIDEFKISPGVRIGSK